MTTSPDLRTRVNDLLAIVEGMTEGPLPDEPGGDASISRGMRHLCNLAAPLLRDLLAAMEPVGMEEIERAINRYGAAVDMLSAWAHGDEEVRAHRSVDEVTKAQRDTRTALLAAVATRRGPMTVEPEWTVEERDGGLVEHTCKRGRARALVLSGYADGMTLGKLMFAPYRNSPNEIEIGRSWFGGGPRTPEESIAEAKAAVLGWAREIGELITRPDSPAATEGM